MKIKTYKGKRIENQFYFFILNKGNNSGKPLLDPCANCYILITETKEEKEFYYWLCYALWQTGKFEPCLIGSVIPFIRVKDVKDLIIFSSKKAKLNQTKFDKILHALIKLNKQYDSINQQLQDIKQIKKYILKDIL